MRTAQKIAAIKDTLQPLEDTHDKLRDIAPAAASLITQAITACMDKLEQLRVYQDEEAQDAAQELAAEHRAYERAVSNGSEGR
jgi:hypothetical protein